MCPHCSRSFKSRGGLGKHLTTCNGHSQHPPATTSDITCPRCTRSFQSKRSLSMHLRHCPITPPEEDDESQQGDPPPCKTPEPADCSDLDQFSATSPLLNQHSAGGSTVDLSSTELSSSSNSLPAHSPAFTPNDMTNSNLCLAPRMLFFPASAKKSWSKADEAIELMLQAESPSFNKLSTKNMMSTLVKAVTTYFSQPTPEERPEARPKAKPHEHEIKRLRRELRTLRKNWRRHRNEPPESTLQLRQAFHAAHRRLKRLTSDSRTSKLNQKRQSTLRQFRADPFRFGQKLFKPKNETKPAFDADAAYNHFVNCYSDDDRSSVFEALDDLPACDDPTSAFKQCPPSFSELTSVLKRKRNNSAPGPNGIPYIVWKMCPSLQKRLLTVICKVWKNKIVPSSWQQAVIILLHKSGPAEDPANFRPIALTNCDGKIFFSIVAGRITSYMRNNKYFDGLTQKGILPGIAGCIEHATLSHEAIRDARLHHQNICLAWLDLRNAFGSVKHMFIQTCLSRYHFPPSLCRLVFNYYEALTAKVLVSKSNLTKPFHYAIGVFQGCVLSPALFNICFQPLLDTIGKVSTSCGWSYTFKSDPTINRDVSAFADDLELCSWQPKLCQAQISICDRYLSWSRTMQARPNKCFSAAMRQSNSIGSSGVTGYDRFDPCLSIAGGRIQYLDDGDFKYLGRLLNTTASEITSRTQLQAKLKTLLSIVDDSLLPGTSRLWLYHHFVVPKLSWAFLTLDLTLTFVKKLQAMAVAFLKKWSGLPRCANTAILFVGDQRRPGLKVHNLCTFWKQQQGVKFEFLRKSLDPRCRKLHDIILARQGKWKRRFAPAVEVACATTVVESNTAAMSRPSSIRQGLGFSSNTSTSPPSNSTLRHQVSSHLRAIDVEEQLSRLKTLQLQGRWLEWSGLMNLDLSWQQLIHNWSDAELRFALQATTNTAPTPLNLRRWGVQSVDPSCQLCGRPASLRHILNACPSALHQGRYTWRHDSVLRIMKRHFFSFWQSTSTQNAITQRANLSSQPYIRFVPAGSVPRRPDRYQTHSSNLHNRHPMSSSKALLLNANDWEFLFDLGDSQLVFPPEIAVTTQRPDIVIFSRSKKAVLLIELTVPLEDRVTAGHTRKENRYAALVQQCSENGWFARCFAVEVGCLGYVSPSLLHCLESLGIPSSTSRKLRNECSRVAHRCSYVLFLRRKCTEWTSWSMG